MTALEIEYSLGTRFIEKEILPTVRELGIGLVAHGVVGQGLLTGSVGNDLPPNDVRLEAWFAMRESSPVEWTRIRASRMRGS